MFFYKYPTDLRDTFSAPIPLSIPHQRQENPREEEGFPGNDVAQESQ